MPVIVLSDEESNEDFSTDESLEFAVEDDEELSDVEELLHDDTKISTLDEGTIREEVCASHKHVLWTIDYQPLQEKTCVMGSPFFHIGSQSYSLELERCDDHVNFSLYRKGPPVYGNIEWWSGLELSNGNRHHEITNGKLGLLEASELWTYVKQLNSFSLVNIERNHIDVDGHITFFFWVSVEQEPVGAEPCIYGAAEMAARGEGNIREEVCCSHKHVLWAVDYEPLREENCVMESPPFSIENQSYSLKLVRCNDHIIFKLYRLGPSIEKNVQWCTGLKRGGGSYHHKIKNGILDLKTECKSWMDMLLLDKFQLSSLKRNHIAADGRITFFFQMNMGQELTTAEACNHSAAEMTLPGEGSIHEVCSSYKHVLWTVDYELLLEEERVLASRAFSVGNQCYLLELKRSYYNVDFTLYRAGSSVDLNVRWWSGLKRGDGSYHPKIKNGILDLKKKCELWTVGILLDSFSVSDLERNDISTDGRVTFFFQMNVEQALTGEETCTHGAAEIVVRGEGSIREEVCSSHTCVLWTVGYESLRKEGREMGSTSFNVGGQSYFLQLKRSYFGINFDLYRMGPSVNESIRWWAGLMRGDGICYHRIENGELDLKDSCELWMFVRHLVWFNSSELERNNFATDGRVTFFFRMNVERTPTTAETCNHGASEMISRGEGSLREEVCSSHKQVLWTVDYEPLPEEDCVTRSPPFSIGNQCYFLELKRSCCDIYFELYRVGPSVERNVRWCAGLKHGEGSYQHNNIMNGILDLETECKSWTHVLSFKKFQSSELDKNIVSDGCVTFFFQTNVERASIGPQACTHGAAEMTPRGEGNIREEACSSKYVLWTVDFEPLREEGRVMVSPAFNIGNQSFLLDLRSVDKDIKFELYRRGPCVDREVRWWAGLKFRDGSCHHVIKNEKFNLDNECELWTIVGQLDEFSSSDLKKNYLTPEGCLTFFFRMSLEITQTITGMCKHGAADMTVRGEGNIREEMCSSHKHVYWSVDYRLLRVTGRVIGSPSFDIGNQSYVLHLETFHDGTKLKLYRMGPCELFERWCAGLKYRKKFYTERAEHGNLDLKEECELWTYVSSLDWFSSAELDQGHIGPDNHLTFFYFMDETLTEAKTNIKSMSARGVGSIVEEVWTSYKLVKWDVDYQPRPEGVPSPVFRIENQRCFLELSYCDGNIKLELNRLGKSVHDSLLWWAVVDDGKSHNYGSKCGKLGFKEETCELWRRGELLHLFEEKDRRMRFTVDFLVRVEPAQADSQTVRDLPMEEIVFRIKSRMEFRISRAILRIRVPVFERMFFHDCIENRTGVVDITDVEPEIFELFLNFIHSGNPLAVNSRHACELYSVADKYLFQELKSVCLQCMEDSLALNTFFDVVRLAYHYSEHDLLKEAIYFFSRNKNDIYTYYDLAWRDFCKNEPDIANKLILSSSPQNT